MPGIRPWRRRRRDSAEPSRVRSVATTLTRSPATAAIVAALCRESGSILRAVPDLAILGQDPGFAGGSRAQTEALWQAAVAAGRRPELLYLRHRRLDGARGGTVLRGRGVAPVLPGLDVANVLVASVRHARPC